MEDFSLKELAIPETLEAIDPDCCYATTIGELKVPAWVTDLSAFTQEDGVYVGRYTVAEGNPVYSSVDGVLFSADGKTLIRYPTDRKDTHYDVPAGTERIADRAFSDESRSIPLKTVSLPMGLKSIGAMAFSGCGRLVSMTVPLTVTEIDAWAFYGCVSLEQLSLPPGLGIEMDRAVGNGDFGRYHGDNGKTATGPDDEYRNGWHAWLDNPEGAGPVTLYRDAACARPLRTAQAGGVVIPMEYRRGAYRVALSVTAGDDDEEVDIWVPREFLRPITGETLFEVVSASFDLNAVPMSAGVFDKGPVDLSRPEEWMYDPWWSMGSEISFCGETVQVQEDGSSRRVSEDVIFFVGDVTMERAHTGDSRTLGILAAGSAAELIRLFEAPEGAETGHAWSGEQAEALETRDGWVLVRTAAGRFWVRSENFRAVEQE